MYLNIENVPNPLEFIRDRLDVHIKCQTESKCQIDDNKTKTEMLDENESHNRSGNVSDVDKFVMDESMDVEETDDIESIKLDDSKYENPIEFHQVSDNSLVDGQILQTIIEKDETECDENVLKHEEMIIDEKVIYPVTQPEPTGDSEKAFVPQIAESNLPNELNENVGIVNEIKNDILENVFENAIEKDDDQPDSDEAIPFYDAPEEMETNELKNILNKVGIEPLKMIEDEHPDTNAAQEEQSEPNKAENGQQNSNKVNENIKEEIEAQDEDQIDSQCIAAPDITFGDLDESTTEFSTYDESAEHIIQLNELVAKRKLSILPDDLETVYLASKSFKVDNNKCTIE